MTETKAKSTPGPWQCENDPDNNVIGREILLTVWGLVDSTPAHKGQLQICKITYGGKAVAENCANARLIAAAPDLLAVAAEIAEIPFTLCQKTRNLEVPRELHERLRLAIAKANGTIVLTPLAAIRKAQPEGGA